MHFLTIVCLIDQSLDVENEEVMQNSDRLEKFFLVLLAPSSLCPFQYTCDF